MPCAYTPASGNMTAGYYCASKDSSLRFSFGSDPDETNGNAWLGAGIGRPGRAAFVSMGFAERHLSVNCFNLQVQLADEAGHTPAIAVGVIDLLNQREGSSGEPHSGRCWYAVATRKVSNGSQPAYVSAGFGNGRYDDRPFGALSWFPRPNILLGFEYDCNLATPHVAFEVAHNENLSASIGGAWPNLDRPVLGFSLTYSTSRQPSTRTPSQQH